MTEMVLELKELRRSFGGVKAVDGLNLSMPRGSIFGLMGPNGAGKTTAVNLITGFFPADGGQVLFDGKDITRLKGHEIAAAGITRTYQNVRLFEGMTAVEEVVAGSHLRRSSSAWQAVMCLPSERRERREMRQRARDLLARVGVESPDELATNLSYGQQRRVEIARALASEPKLLLLDEPTAGMNSKESAEIGELMQQLRSEGVSILVIEHNMALILEHCDFALVQNFGRPIMSGTPRECVDDAQVQEAYFGRKSDAERVNALRELRRHTGGE
jgi:branched-chain amino acid transport system ATP-binding protein